MATKTIIPEEYVRLNKEFDEQAYIQQRINDAIKKSKEREQGIDIPKWWKIKYPDEPFDNCIGTALDNYGIGVTGNLTWAKDYEKYGFRKLNDDEEQVEGDIVQVSPDLILRRPNHALFYIGKDKDNNLLYNYGRGEVTDGYDSPYVKNSTFYNDEPIYARYRYVGAPDELDQIRKHNANVKNNNELKSAPKEHFEKELSQAKPQSVSQDDTVKFLENIVNKYRK